MRACTPLVRCAQLARIEVEWGDYLKAMHREYLKEVARLEGVAPDELLAQYEQELAAAPSTGSVKGLWLDKEKQEQLVRTPDCPGCCPPLPGDRGGLSRSTPPQCCLQLRDVGLLRRLVAVALDPAVPRLSLRQHPQPSWRLAAHLALACPPQFAVNCTIFESRTRRPVR
jgi:hypothetical protein